MGGTPRQAPGHPVVRASSGVLADGPTQGSLTRSAVPLVSCSSLQVLTSRFQLTSRVKAATSEASESEGLVQSLVPRQASHSAFLSLALASVDQGRRQHRLLG